MKRTSGLIFAILLLAAAAAAQTAAGTGKPVIRERVVMGSQDAEDAIFLLSEMDGLGKVVKDAPYTATAVTETTQTLADGNRIVNRASAFLARDSAGRMRREENMAKLGNLTASVSKAIMIQDPVAKVEYLVQPVGVLPEAELKKEGLTHAATREPKVTTFELFQSATTGKISLGGPNGRGTKTWVEDVTTEVRGATDKKELEDADANMKHESLGMQVIEGVTAEGVRDTKTIPAGAIGNEKPIVITSEVWTSPELQIVVLSKRNDPRFGETVYKLTEITRGEPDPALFQPPEKPNKNAVPTR